MAAAETLSLEFVHAHPVDAARVLERFTPAESASLLAELPVADAGSVLGRMVVTVGADCVGQMPAEPAALVLAELSIDHASSLLRRLPKATAERILDEAPARVLAAALRMLIAYPEGTAGSLVDPTVLTLPVDLDAGEALARVRRAPEHAIYYLYVLDRAQRLVGVLNLRELMLAPPDVPLASVMHATVARINANAGEAEILAHSGWREYHALPVVDADLRYVGVIRYETLRRLEHVTASIAPNPAVDTALSLVELYWLGLRGVIDGVAQVATGRPDGEADAER